MFYLSQPLFSSSVSPMALPLMSAATEAPITCSESLKTRILLHGNKGLPAASFSLKRIAPFHPPLSGRRNQTFVVSAEKQTQTVEKQQTETQTGLRRRNFPKDFVFGAATSAYQIEGAVNEGGREPSIWDTFSHKYPEKIAGGATGDIACDSYHRYKEDVQALKDLGLNAYRFSISWSRILPKGRGKVNLEGVRYYNNLINELVANGIQPYVTIFHWDVPQVLQDEYGGFLDDKIVEDFKGYADVLFREFGDRVKHWITINEGLMFTTLGSGLGLHAPGRCTDGLDILGILKLNCPAGGDSLREPYIVAHNIIRSHADAVYLYRQKYQSNQKGAIGITHVSHWMVPIDDTPQSKEAQERALQFNMGWFMDPLKFGDYPFSMRALVGDRLPRFTPEEIEKVKDSYDFIGLNYYTSRYALSQQFPKDFKPTSYLDDPRVEVRVADLNDTPIDHAEPGSWINVHPSGLRKLLLYIKNRYDNPPIYITENGVIEKDNKELKLHEALNDTHRLEYLTLHLHELSEAYKAGVDVRGYFTWSLMDNFDWHDGYEARLGLYFIDFFKNHNEHLLENEKADGHTPPNLRRIPKNSTVWFKRFLHQ